MDKEYHPPIPHLSITKLPDVQEENLINNNNNRQQQQQINNQQKINNYQQEQQIRELYNLIYEHYNRLKLDISNWSSVVSKNTEDLKKLVKEVDINRFDATIARMDKEIRNLNDITVNLKTQNEISNPNMKIDFINTALIELKSKMIEMDKVNLKNLSEFKNYRTLSEQFDKKYADDISSVKDQMKEFDKFKTRTLMATSLMTALLSITIGVLTAIGQLT